MFQVDTTDSFTPASTRSRPERSGHAGTHGVRNGWRLWVLACLLALQALAPARAAEPAVEQMALQRTSEGLFLSARVALEPSPAVEDALLKGVPLYFVWEAVVMRDRWYWTDKRIASVLRTWRLAYQPLTRRWRLSLSTDPVPGAGASGLQYALHQNFDNLPEALASVGRVARWKVADARQAANGADQRVEFSFRLDLSLLPRPFQIGMANQPEWVIEVQRELDVPRQIEPDPVADDAATNAAR